MVESDSMPRLRPRETSDITLDLPVDVIESLEEIAASRDMNLRALLRFYIGQSMRADLDRLYSDKFADTTARVLAERLESEDEVSAILKEIRHRISTIEA